MSTFFGIAGILATIVVAIFEHRRRKYPGQITYIQEDVIPLFDSIVKNHPELTISYEEKEVSEGLVLLKAALINTGSKDITPSMVEECIKLVLPTEFQWKKVKLVSHSPDHSGAIDINNQALVFYMDMFRCKEHVRFEAIAEVPITPLNTQGSNKSSAEKLEAAIFPSHRIADTQPIRKKDFPNEEYIKSFLRKFKIPYLVLCIPAAILFCLVAFFPPGKIVYSIPIDGMQTEIRISPKAHNAIELNGVINKEFSTIIPIQEFLTYPGLKTEIQVNRLEGMLEYWWLFYLFLFPTILMAAGYWFLLQTRKLRKLLNTEVKTGCPIKNNKEQNS